MDIPDVTVRVRGRGFRQHDGGGHAAGRDVGVGPGGGLAEEIGGACRAAGIRARERRLGQVGVARVHGAVQRDPERRGTVLAAGRGRGVAPGQAQALPIVHAGIGRPAGNLAAGLRIDEERRQGRQVQRRAFTRKILRGQPDAVQHHARGIEVLDGKQVKAQGRVVPQLQGHGRRRGQRELHLPPVSDHPARDHDPAHDQGPVVPAVVAPELRLHRVGAGGKRGDEVVHVPSELAFPGLAILPHLQARRAVAVHLDADQVIHLVGGRVAEKTARSVVQRMRGVHRPRKVPWIVGPAPAAGDGQGKEINQVAPPGGIRTHPVPVHVVADIQGAGRAIGLPEAPVQRPVGERGRTQTENRRDRNKNAMKQAHGYIPPRHICTYQRLLFSP